MFIPLTADNVVLHRQSYNHRHLCGRDVTTSVGVVFEIKVLGCRNMRTHRYFKEFGLTVQERPQERSQEVQQSQNNFQDIHVNLWDGPTECEDAARRENRAGKSDKTRLGLALGRGTPTSKTPATP